MIKRLLLPSMASCLLLASCDNSFAGDGGSPAAQSDPKASMTAQDKQGPSIPDWDATACGDDAYRNARMERHPDLTRRTATDLLAAYGAPHADEQFRAGDGVGTYRGGVASQLPGGAPKNAETVVREIIWQREKCNFIVRFAESNGNWRVFDAFEASADADF